MTPHEFLISLGVKDVPHSGRSFYDHLCNTEQILRICRQLDYVCLAGLYHSIYGTNFFQQATTTDRDAVRAVIGAKAERLAWLFGRANRPYCWYTGNFLSLTDGTVEQLDNQTLQDLRMIEGANLLDQQCGLDMITSVMADNMRVQNAN